MYKILVLNTGSTSTKLAIYHDAECVFSKTLHLHLPEGADRTNTDDQLKYRTQEILTFLDESNMKITDFDIIASRCGQIPRHPAECYWANQLMCDVLRFRPISNHASNYAPMISLELTKGTNIPVVAPHAPTSFEMSEIAQVSGCKAIPLKSGSHVLNSKYVARLSAERLGKTYETGTFIVAHMGGGSSVTLHHNGKMIDVYAAGIGPMSVERVGFLPVRDVLNLCFSGKYTKAELNAMFFNNGGFAAYGGTNDALDIEKRALAGDKECALTYEASAYQVAKSIGAHYTAMKGKVDAIILTGSLARSSYLTDMIMDYIKCLNTPVDIYPGEREMDALAGFALRTLKGEEHPVEFTLLPDGYATAEEFYEDFAKAE